MLLLLKPEVNDKIWKKKQKKAFLQSLNFINEMSFHEWFGLNCENWPINKWLFGKFDVNFHWNLMVSIKL